jgi:ribose 5-phosphate isomerase B
MNSKGGFVQPVIYLASDHGGFEVKKKVKNLLSEMDFEVKDLGPHRHQDGDDYPDFILPLADMVAKTGQRGIISCRNGQGAAIAANKVKGIRAAVCWNEECARTSRTDDDTNILSLPADYLTDDEIERIVKNWLETEFSDDARHLRRIAKIKDYEREN